MGDEMIAMEATRLKACPARDIKGRGPVAKLDVPVTGAGITATPEDFVFGETDGPVFVPRACSGRRLTKTAALFQEKAPVQTLSNPGRSISEMLKPVKTL